MDISSGPCKPNHGTESNAKRDQKDRNIVNNMSDNDHGYNLISHPVAFLKTNLSMVLIFDVHNVHDVLWLLGFGSNVNLLVQLSNNFCWLLDN